MRPLSITVLLLSLSLLLFSLLACAPKRSVQPSEQSQYQEEGTRPGASSEGEKEALSRKGQLPSERITERELTGVKESEGVDVADGSESEIRDIYFDYDSYTVREEAKPALRRLAAKLSRSKGLKVIIEGHCDDRGTTEYNLSLGDRRVLAVKSYLASLGIPSSQIETISYGEEKPLCTEQTESCWTQNRRAHFVFIEEGK